MTRDGRQNPATYGTFPRTLSTYVQEGLFSLKEAIREMTGGAAERLRWTDRGWVRPECAADLVVLDAVESAGHRHLRNTGALPARHRARVHQRTRGRGRRAL